MNVVLSSGQAVSYRDLAYMRPGIARREGFIALFKAHPTWHMPVNCKWQLQSNDVDLAHLLKKGVLERIRSGGGKAHHMNKSGSKRQTYLVLSKAYGGQVNPADIQPCEVLRIRMYPNDREPGWVARLQDAGLRVSHSPQRFGRTSWLIKQCDAHMEVLQSPSIVQTTVIHAPTAGQLKIAGQLVKAGIALVV
ncbi:UDP-N-acetylglucosamine 1-carboxyvinyltransferase [Novimethylophilus kurashikiensis]|uniref:UDP-N-acetylglucosamine 1-carboxyvinyltransferase n=1 Tax=Novimethylophilus kurashikiensis TaxID=1825523 RepID=A0A2R5FCB3_9PROT|nr:hypothetical protein [Novimethylophilus kurashikiensis]GBG14573.1 UDP-N-acetylglucosamine 1-carboxyvinyltransferase [Novimethylophilus kurashikiensis]